MNPLPAAARILIAGTHDDDVGRIRKLLEAEFTQIRVAADRANAVADFDAFAPQVLILAFARIAAAQAYQLDLHRSSEKANDCRSVLLCDTDEAQAAFELCKKGAFDDFVVQGLQAQDGVRLAMSVWTAARQPAAATPRQPSTLDLIAHVRQLGAVQAIVKQQGQYADLEAFTGQQLKIRLGAQLDAMNAFAEKVRQLRPVVMVVEDDEVSHVLIEQALQDKGYELVFATDAAVALGLLRRIRPDLILMDVNLPDIDGVALTLKLKAQPDFAAVPVLMVTGEARRETLESSMSAGAEGFIVKPFTRASLVAKLDRFFSLSA